MPQAETTALAITPSRLRCALQARVSGQDDALEPIIDAITLWEAGLAGIDKPAGAFLMLGPTGVGKTLTVEAAAEVLHGDSRKLIRIHCAEYRHSHEIAKLIGSPPGYLGHRETAAVLSSGKIAGVRSSLCNLSLVLFDEIEKAHYDLYSLLLGVMDKGELCLGDNTRTDMRSAMLFFTSNAGSREAVNSIGFTPEKKQAALGAARRVFSPEFRNRLTATVVYRPLSADNIRHIAELELKRSIDRIFTAREVIVDVARDAIGLVAEAGMDLEFGARPIRRAVEQLLELPLARLLIATPEKKRFVVRRAQQQLQFSDV